jgi:alkyldihydroxyacetonephosphate synthase
MKSSVTQLVELAPALTAHLGPDAVLTEDAQLDAYTADTYWPAISARAGGAPLGRPDVVALPRS